MGSLSGQQPNKRLPPPPAPLLPAEPAWLTNLPALPAAAGALDPDRVYVPLQEGGTISLDRETGTMAWSNPLGTTWPLTLAGHAVIAVTTDEVAALDRETGEMIWQVPLPAPSLGPAAAAADRVVVPLENGSLIALGAADGATAWSLAVEGLAAPVALSADAKAVYLTMAGGRVSAVGVASGQLLWRAQLSGTLSPPALGKDRVLVGSTSNAFYALDPDNGKLEWTWGSGMIGGDVIGSAVDGDVIYFASLDNILHAINRGNGNQRWKQTMPTRPTFPPIAFGGLVAVFGVSPAIATFNAKTGAALSTFAVPTAAGATTAGELKGPPLIDPDLHPFRVALVIVTADGRVMGLRPTGMMFREAAPVPFTELPGRPLTRERSPLAP